MSFRSSRTRKGVPKAVTNRVAVAVAPVESAPCTPLLELAIAHNSSLKATLGNAMKDNSELREKLEQAKKDLKAAREKNKSLADYKEWRTKAELGYNAGFSAGSNQVYVLTLRHCHDLTELHRF